MLWTTKIRGTCRPCQLGPCPVIRTTTHISNVQVLFLLVLGVLQVEEQILGKVQQRQGHATSPENCGIVSKCHDSRETNVRLHGKKFLWPKESRLFSFAPCISAGAPQAVYEHNVGFVAIWRHIHNVESQRSAFGILAVAMALIRRITSFPKGGNSSCLTTVLWEVYWRQIRCFWLTADITWLSAKQ